MRRMDLIYFQCNLPYSKTGSGLSRISAFPLRLAIRRAVAAGTLVPVKGSFKLSDAAKKPPAKPKKAAKKPKVKKAKKTKPDLEEEEAGAEKTVLEEAVAEEAVAEEAGAEEGKEREERKEPGLKLVPGLKEVISGLDVSGEVVK